MYEVSSIALPDDPDDYVTPDLIVLPWEPVPLPEPFGIEVGTGDFPVYDEARRP
ncbi:hypothetical protein ACWC0C_00070 [Streptomyces sp. NPDC001709]